MRQWKKQIPNALTVLRMALSVLLLLPPLRSVRFFALYALCILTDVLDGPLARRLGASSRTGAALDTLADLLFALCVGLRLLPALRLPAWIWIAAGVTALLRLSSAIVARMRFGRFGLLHTALNKASGAAVCLLPLALLPGSTALLCAAVALIALLSAVEELLLMLRAPAFDPDCRGLLFEKRAR